jgi:Sec-independent protein secretion pathway component TatC
MLISMVPLLVLFEGSILLASWVHRRDLKRARAAGESEDIDVEPNDDDTDSEDPPG